MQDTFPASIKELKNHNTDTAAHPNGFDHNIDMHYNSIKYVTFVDCTDHITVDTSMHETNTSKKPVIWIKSGNEIGSDGQQGALMFKDKNNVQISIVEASTTDDTSLLRIKVSSPTETGTEAGTGFTVCEFMVAPYLSNEPVPYINMQYRYIANARLHSAEIRDDEALVNKQYVDDRAMGLPDYANMYQITADDLQEQLITLSTFGQQMFGVTSITLKSYTVPQNGWINMGLTGTDSSFSYVFVNGSPVFSVNINDGRIIQIPVSKDDVVSIADATTGIVAFIPAKS